MPTYTVTDPASGRQLRLTGDSPPTEQELEEVFASTAPDGGPSAGGAFVREGVRSVLPAGAGFLGGAGAGALAGMAGGPFAPITVPASALVGGVASAFGARKLQDAIADEVAPESFMGSQSAAEDYQAQPLAAFGGGLVAGGRPSISRVGGAIKSVATTEGRQALGQVVQSMGQRGAMQALQHTNPAAINAFGDLIDVASGAGLGAGMSAASGESPGMVLANLLGGAVFNKPWIGGSNAVLPQDASISGNGPMVAPAANDAPLVTEVAPVGDSPMPQVVRGPMPEVPLSAGPQADPQIQAALQAFLPTIDPTRPTVNPMVAQQPPSAVPLQFEQPMTKAQLAETLPAEPVMQPELPALNENQSRINSAKELIPMISDVGGQKWGVASGDSPFAPQRPFVLVKIGDSVLPFYRSSRGTGGKQEGGWSPFFGMGKNEKGPWMIKGSLDEISNGYGNPEIKRVQDLLNSVTSGKDDLWSEEFLRANLGEEAGGLDEHSASRLIFGSDSFEATPSSSRPQHQVDALKKAQTKPLPANEPNPATPELQPRIAPQENPLPQLAESAALPDPAGQVRPVVEGAQGVGETGLADLGGAGKAIADNFYSGVEKSLIETGDVPAAERGTRVGKAWDMVKDRASGDPDLIPKFSAAIRSAAANGDTPESWSRAVSVVLDSPVGATAAASEPATGDLSIRSRLAAASEQVGESIQSDISEGRLNVVFPGLDTVTAKRVYKAAIDTAIAAIDAGERIGKAVNKAVVATKAALGKAFTPQVEKELRDELNKNLPVEIDRLRQRVRQTDEQVRKIAVVDTKEGAPKPTEAEFRDRLEREMPDQKDIIAAEPEPQKVYDDPALKKGEYPDEGEETKWPDYYERSGEVAEKTASDLRSGKTFRDVKAKLKSANRELFTSKSSVAHQVADGVLPGTTKSAAAKDFVTEAFGSNPGDGNVGKTGIDADRVRELTKRANSVDKAMENLKPRMERMKRADREAFKKRVGDLMTTPGADLSREPKDVQAAIKALKDFYDTARADLKEAGYDVGDWGADSMPRIFDADKRANNPIAFHRDLVETYKAKFAREIKAAEDAGDTVQASKLKKEYTDAEAEKRARAYEKNLAMNEAGISTDGDDFKLAGSDDGLPNTLKTREFGEEADRLLGNYYVRDPFTVARYTAENVERLIATAKLLGTVDPKTGRIDRLGKWKKLRDDLIAEGNEKMVSELARVISSTFGLDTRVGPKMQKFAEFSRTWGWISLLDRATFSSIPEPLMVGISTGKVGDSAKALAVTIRQAARRLGGLPKNQRQIIAEGLGYVQSGLLSRLASAHASDPFASGGWAKLADDFFNMTGLTGWTHSTIEAATDIGLDYVATLAKLAKTDARAAKDLRSLGVNDDEMAALDGFADNMAKGGKELVLGNSAGADLMRRAMDNFMRRTVVNPTQGDKAMHAAHPVGSLFYNLQSYLYGYSRNVSGRMLREAIRAEGKEKIPAATKLAVSMGGMAAANFAVTMLREKLFHDPERARKDAKRKDSEILAARLGATASRANFLGAYDPIFNAITSAKYQRDPATIMVGPIWGIASEIFKGIAAQGGDRDSPNTNTAERKLARNIYTAGVKPGMSAFLAGLPSARAAGVANYAISHPIARETFVRGTAGAPNAPERGKSAKKGGPMPNF